MSDRPEGGYREMDEIDLAGLNHVRHEIEQCSNVSKLTISDTVNMYVNLCNSGISTEKASENLKKAFSKILHDK